MQATTAIVSKRPSASAIRVRPAHIPANILAAAELIYFAITDPSCEEIRSVLEKAGILNHAARTLDLATLHKELIHAIPIARLTGAGQGATAAASRYAAQGGEMSVQRCILLGLLVILLTVASYIISIRADVSLYQAKCANVMMVFDPKRGSVGTFFTELNKFTMMVFNKEHIDYCKSMQDKYGNLGTYLAKELNKTMSSLRARLTTSIAIVTAIVGLMNGGLKALICIAARWLGEVDRICSQECSNNKRASPAAFTGADEDDE